MLSQCSPFSSKHGSKLRVSLVPRREYFQEPPCLGYTRLLLQSAIPLQLNKNLSGLFSIMLKRVGRLSLRKAQSLVTGVLGPTSRQDRDV